MCPGLLIFQIVLLLFQVNCFILYYYIILHFINIKCFIGDHTLCVWNSTKPGVPVVKLTAHASEVLTCDWSKYDRNIIASGGVDGRIRAWDLRNTSAPCFELGVNQFFVLFT